MNQRIDYSNGLRLVVDYNPSVRSVAVGFWVGAGSTKEDEKNNGISHFTEHVMFKGTADKTAFEVANEFEKFGALVNAFTGKESTCYYVKSVDEYAEQCFALLSDIFMHSVFPAEELDKERKVIVEEINMEEDSPEDICYDLLAQAMYGGSPIGRTILGPADNVLRFTREDVKEYMRRFYNADNVVVSVAGNVTPETADKWVRKYCKELPSHKTDKTPLSPHKVTGGYAEKIKPFEQSNIGISYPSVPYGDKLYATQSVLSILFGGGMSSRLFQRVREQMGLAYSVYSSPLLYKNNGNFDIMLNITPANTRKAIAAVRGEIETLLSGGVTQEEFDKAKTQLKAGLVFSQENVLNVMTAQGKLMMLGNELYNVNSRLADIDAVTKDGVNDFARRIFTSDNVCGAYVGKKVDEDVIALIRGK